jgi:hypothetical protein
MCGDENFYTSRIQEHRENAKKAFDSQNKDDFLKSDFELHKTLESLPRNHPFYLNAELLFTGPHSHLHQYMKYILVMSFKKGICAATGTAPNNHSGYYLIGPRGVGKTNLMRTCCLLSGLLIPNFAAVYADCVSVGEETKIEDLAAFALDEHDVVLSDCNIEKVRALARMKDLSIGIFLDEAHIFYTPSHWRAIHSLITNYTDAVFMTGSDFRLSVFVSGDPRDTPVIKRLGLRPIESLNDTKLTPLTISGLSSLEQYYIFLDNRPQLKLAFFSK